MTGYGVSAGGLIFGAIASHPELGSYLGRAVLEAPFLNIHRAMQRAGAGEGGDALIEHEKEEWGDISEGAVEQCIRSYCPLHTSAHFPDPYTLAPDPVAGGPPPTLHFPSLYVTVGSRDEKVSPGDVRQWVGNIREKHARVAASLSAVGVLPPPAPVYEYRETGWDHEGAVAVSEQVEGMADMLAFILADR